MKKSAILILMFMLALPVIGKKSYTKKEIQKMYGDILIIKVIDYKGKILFHTPDPELPETHILSEFIKNNASHINYIRSYFMNLSDDLPPAESFLNHPEKLQDEFIKFMNNNTDFMKHFESMIFNYLISKGNNIKDYEMVQPNLSSDRVVDAMAKLFYINKITPNKKYGGKFCAGMNGYKSTIKDRNFHLEAFCFNILFNNFKTLIPIYQQTIKSIESLKLGLDKEDRILRAQGAMYLAISQNSKIRGLLKTEYLKRKNYLPFRIPGWE